MRIRSSAGISASITSLFRSAVVLKSAVFFKSTMFFCAVFLDATSLHAAPPIQTDRRPIESIPSDVRSDLNDAFSQALNGLFIFTSTDSVSSGVYRFRDAGESNTKFQVLKLAGTYAFGDFDKDVFVPYVNGQAGFFQLREEIEPIQGEGDNDFSTVDSTSAGLGAGAAVRFFEGFSAGPEFNLVYARTENHYDYNNPFSQQYLQVYERDIFNWKIDSLTYMPATTMRYQFQVDDVKVISTAKYTQMFVDSVWTNSGVLNINTSSGLLNSRIELRIPTPRCVGQAPLEVRPFFSRTDLYRDARDGLGFNYFHQVGVTFVALSLTQLPVFSSLGFGFSYSWNAELEGYRLGFEADF